jgi:hypothetical protein
LKFSLSLSLLSLRLGAFELGQDRFKGAGLQR